MRPIIRVENLGKQFRIGARQSPYGTFRDRFDSWLRSPRRRRAEGDSGQQTIWALRDVGFEVLPGEVIGVIGRNGAGKSTLLKLLSRVTEPTVGRIELFGRVGSLLEVGTGFHPELTGRENVYLYGAILGMAHAEVRRKFDEIVAFSEIEKFIDTPVKHYSSGMYMRLAFSVPAHLEPEIMLVDEVLAVGDLSFQQKCLDRMRLLKRSGTTILLVSHNMAAIQNTCERSILLDGGTVAAAGDTAQVIVRFRNALSRKNPDGGGGHYASTDSYDTGITLEGFEMYGEDGQSRRNFRFGERVRIRIELNASRRVEMPVINFGLRRADGVIVCNFNNRYDDFRIDYVEGACVLEGWLPPLRLIPHFYEIHVLAWPPRVAAESGEMNALLPLAAATFGEFSIEGPPLTDQDGVFQEPALKWTLIRGAERIEYPTPDAESIFRGYAAEEARPVGEGR
jgi:lipopolysaccharide transport system ATP-binding protein